MLVVLIFFLNILGAEEWNYIHLATGKCVETPENTFKFLYDENGKVKEVLNFTEDSNTFERVCILEYSPNATVVTNAKGVVTKHYFNYLKEVEKIETYLPDGSLYRSQEFEWNRNLLLRKSLKDHESRLLFQQRFVYDGQNHLIKEILDGPLTDAANNFESIEKTYYYDDEHRLIQEELEDLTITYSYHLKNKKPSTKCVLDAGVVVEKTFYTYDEEGQGQLIEMKVDDGVYQVIQKEESLPQQTVAPPLLSQACTYDCFGRKISETTPFILGPDEKPLQWITNYIYDPLDRMIEMINPENESTKFVYNVRGQPLEIQYSDGSIEKKFYTLGGRLKKEMFRDQTYVLYEWDGLGRIKKCSYFNCEDQCIKFHIYEYRGRELFKETFSTGITIEHYYDHLGKKIESINTATGRKVSYEYDEEGKLCLQKEWLNEDSYLQNNIESPPKAEKSPLQLEWIINDRGQTVLQTTNTLTGTIILYDALQRIERVEASSFKRHLRHNSQGKKIKEIFELPNHSFVNRWTYNREGQLLVQIEAEGSIDERRTYYSYTPSGKLESQLNPNGIKIHYLYDPSGRLSRLYSSDNSINYELCYTSDGALQTLMDHNYGLKSERSYNLEGQVIQEKLANGLTMQNSYDLIGRRKSLTLPDSSQIFYHFEEGNLQAIERHGQLLNPEKILKEGVEKSYLTKPEGLEYDLAGNLIKKISNGDIFLFTYDAFHRLISIKKNNEEIHHYVYDLFHRRLMDTVSESSYIYDGNWEIGRVQADKIIELRILEPSLTAEHGPFISLELNDVRYTPSFDSQGSLTALVNEQGESIATHLSPWQFAGKRYDPLSGLIHFGRRDYDPALGKFTTPDPLGFIDGPDRYAYLPKDFFGLKSMSERWEEFTHSTLNFCEGLKDKILNALQYLKNSHSIKISHIFETMLGPGFILLGGFRPTESELGTYGKGELNDKVRVSFTNGILTDKGYLTNTLKSLSESHGNVNIHYVYRPTKGWVYDILHSCAVGIGLVSEQAELLAKEWRRMIQEIGNEGKIIHYAHSIGTIESQRALSLLTEEEQRLIHIYAFGSPNLAEVHPHLQTYNFVSIHDGVCLLNLIGYIKACTGSIPNVAFAGSLLSIPFVDHLFGNQTYQDIWKSMGRTFTEWYGTL